MHDAARRGRLGARGPWYSAMVPPPKDGNNCMQTNAVAETLINCSSASSRGRPNAFISCLTPFHHLFLKVGFHYPSSRAVNSGSGNRPLASFLSNNSIYLHHSTLYPISVSSLRFTCHNHLYSYKSTILPFLQN